MKRTTLIATGGSAVIALSLALAGPALAAAEPEPPSATAVAPEPPLAPEFEGGGPGAEAVVPDPAPDDLPEKGLEVLPGESLPGPDEAPVLPTDECLEDALDTSVPVGRQEALTDLPEESLLGPEEDLVLIPDECLGDVVDEIVVPEPEEGGLPEPSEEDLPDAPQWPEAA